MNYQIEQLRAKVLELEARIEALEQGQRKQTEFPGAPQWIDNMPRIEPRTTWPQPPYTITCKNQQGKEFH